MVSPVFDEIQFVLFIPDSVGSVADTSKDVITWITLQASSDNHIWSAFSTVFINDWAFFGLRHCWGRCDSIDFHVAFWRTVAITCVANRCPDVTVVNCSWITLVELEPFAITVSSTMISTSLFGSDSEFSVFEVVYMFSIVTVLVYTSALSLGHLISRIWSKLFAMSTHTSRFWIYVRIWLWFRSTASHTIWSFFLAFLVFLLELFKHILLFHEELCLLLLDLIDGEF